MELSPDNGIWIWQYRLHSNGALNAVSGRASFDGILIRTGEGFGCIQPWTELGDPPLHKCIEDLAGPRRWPIVRRALRCAEFDAAAREADDSLFDEMEIPISHATLAKVDAAEIDRAIAAGFTIIKLKAGRDLAAEGEFLDAMAAAHPSLRWRLDFNESLDAGKAAGFLLGRPAETRSRIDFVEDPCPYGNATWTDLRRKTGVRLAVDREAAPLCAAAQTLVIKPALDEPWLLAEAAANRGQRVVVTSYMDHPLGQCFAAWEAARLGLEIEFRGALDICGLQTHHLFAKNAFSEMLGDWSPVFQPPGGTGLGFNDLLDELPWKRLS